MTEERWFQLCDQMSKLIKEGGPEDGIISGEEILALVDMLDASNDEKADVKKKLVIASIQGEFCQS